MPIGPQLPPHLSGGRAATPSDEEEDDFGPALPPHLAAKRKEQPKTRDIGPQRPPTAGDDERSAGPSMGPSIGPSIGPTVGPSRPSAFDPIIPARAPAPRPAPPPADDDDSDDDFVGPRLGDMAAAPKLSAAEEFKAREARWAAERAEASTKKGPTKRDDWMLVPPTSGSLSHIDPLKRPTSFQKSSRAAVTADEQRGWTESPAEKAQRMADEVAGIKRRPERGEEDDELERKRRKQRDRDIRDGVERHTKNSRGESLLDQHSAKKAAEEEEEPAFWDHSQHMGITGRLLTDQEREKKIKDARGLNDRFGHGKGGAYAM